MNISVEVVQLAIKQASYQVLLKEGLFELRRYDTMVTINCRESDLGGGSGFNRLFNFINGNNQDAKKISMTTPVINYPETDEPIMAFVMPPEFKLQDLPRPNDPSLELREIKERRMAVLRFSGAINTRRINQKKAELLKWIEEKQLPAVGEVILARYNPPIVPGLFRHNELLLEIQEA